MKLTNIQRETIVKDIYNTIVKSQADFIKNEIDANLTKRIAQFKKTDDYKEFLALEKLVATQDLRIRLTGRHKFATSQYDNELSTLEKTIKYIYTEELKSTLTIPNKQDIEDKLILSTIGDFDFEEFKKGILSDFGI